MPSVACCFVLGAYRQSHLQLFFLLTGERNFVLTATAWQSLGSLIVHARIYMLISFVFCNSQANQPIPHVEACP